MKKIVNLLVSMQSKINDADKEFRCSFDKNDIKCNPFISNPVKTYIWVEKLKKDIF